MKYFCVLLMWEKKKNVSWKLVSMKAKKKKEKIKDENDHYNFAQFHSWKKYVKDIYVRHD